MARNTLYLMAATAALGLSACGEKAPAPGTNVAATDLPPPAPVIGPDQAFANQAAASDAFEIQVSTLAAEKSESSAVQAFARQMITAHTDSTAKLKTVAAGASPAIMPDPTLTADQQTRLTELKGKSGADFDTAYAAEQVKAHQATLDALHGYSATGAVPELKTFATSMTPIVTAHLNMAKSLKP